MSFAKGRDRARSCTPEVRNGESPWEVKDLSKHKKRIKGKCTRSLRMKVLLGEHVQGNAGFHGWKPSHHQQSS